MAVSSDYLAYVLDQFAPFAKPTTRRMFGGIGLYWDELFFGLIDDDVLYLKVDGSNRDDYVSRGCPAFHPTPELTSMNYYQVPEDVLEDSDVLRSWARKSHAIAAQQALAKASKKKKTAKKAPAKRSATQKTARRR